MLWCSLWLHVGRLGWLWCSLYSRGLLRSLDSSYSCRWDTDTNTWKGDKNYQLSHQNNIFKVATTFLMSLRICANKNCTDSSFHPAAMHTNSLQFVKVCVCVHKSICEVVCFLECHDHPTKMSRVFQQLIIFG